jgi:hypothetical protein
MAIALLMSRGSAIEIKKKKFRSPVISKEEQSTQAKKFCVDYKGLRNCPETVAQLEERVFCKYEVVGSTPSSLQPII